MRNYLISLRDPSALRDDGAVVTLQTTIDQTDYALERLRLRHSCWTCSTPTRAV